MLAVKAQPGLLSGKFRDGDLTVNEGAWSMLDPKKPKERAFITRWAGTHIVVRPGQDAALADAQLELRPDGHVSEKKPAAKTDEPKKESPKKA